MNKSYYAIIPANVRYDRDLTPNAKLIYGEITALCNEKGYCWANNSYFSELYGSSKKSVSKWISQLIDKNYLTSKIVYKEGTKEVKERRLYIGSIPMEEKFHTYGRKVHGPMEEKVKDNIKDNNKFNNIYSSAISYLNEKADKAYKATTKKTQSLIKARIDEGFMLDDFKKVIDIKVKEWGNNPDMNKYLRPETLFGTKFESYLNQGTNSVQASKNFEYEVTEW